nr:ankyrin repeat domain-containing protein [Pseudomonadota bacterium]
AGTVCVLVFAFMMLAGSRNDANELMWKSLYEGNVTLLESALAMKPDLEPWCGPYEICKPLAWAVQKGDMEIIRMLVAAGADPNGKNAYGDTAFVTVDHAEQMAGKSREDIRQIRKFLLENGTDPNQENDFGVTPFMGTVAVGDIELLELCLQKGAHVNFRNRNDWTPLMSAAQFNQPAAAQWLLQKGANLALKDRHGKTALDYALLKGNTDVAGILSAPK